MEYDPSNKSDTVTLALHHDCKNLNEPVRSVSGIISNNKVQNQQIMNIHKFVNTGTQNYYSLSSGFRTSASFNFSSL